MFRHFVITALFVSLPSVVDAQNHWGMSPPPTFEFPPGAAVVFPTIPTESPIVVPEDPPSPALPDFDPNDPQLSELWKKVETVQKERNDLDEIWRQHVTRLNSKETEARKEFMDKLGEKRLEELRSRRATEKIDVTKIGLGPLDFPEINGSTSCSNLARLITCRVLGVPYQWTAEMKPIHGQQMMNLQVVIDEEQASARAVTIMKDLLREFGGTHQAYRSLIEVPAQQEPSKLQPLVPAVVVPFAPSVQQQYYYPSAPITMPLPVPAGSIHHTSPVSPPAPADLIIVARRPSDDELALAKQHKVELDIRPIALDALVLLVNRRNPVQNLTIEQILKIYDVLQPAASPVYPVQLFMWQEFGGLPNRQGVPYERERNSGSRELMDALIAEHRKPIPPGQFAQRTQTGYIGQLTNMHSMIGPMFTLNNNENGIAYSVFNYEHFMMLNPNVKALKIDDIEPTSETIRQRTYPAVAEVFVVTKKGIADDSPAARLRDFLLSEDGQRLVHEAGYVPIKSEPQRAGDGAQRSPRTEAEDQLTVRITKDDKIIIGDTAIDITSKDKIVALHEAGYVPIKSEPQRAGDGAQRSPRTEAEDQLTVRITKNDRAIIGDMAIDITSKDKIVALIEKVRKSDRMLFIADALTPHESVKLLLEAAGDAGIKRIEFEVLAE